MGLVLSMAFACSEPALFRGYRNFDGYWPASEKVIFEIDTLTNQPVNLMIYVRNDPHYPFSNLFLIAYLKTGDSLFTSQYLFLLT